MQEAVQPADFGNLRHTKLTFISGSQPWLSRGLGLYPPSSAPSTAEELPEVDWGEPDEEVVATGPSAAAATSLGELDRPTTEAGEPKRGKFNKMPAITPRGHKLGLWADLHAHEEEARAAAAAEEREASRAAGSHLPAPPPAPVRRPSPDEDTYDLRCVRVDLSCSSVWTPWLT